MDVVALIPARYGSTRFPGKPLAKDTGKFLIQHVVEQVGATESVARCLVATDDQRIVDAVASFGGEAVLTRADHQSGTDRIAEVVRGLGCDADDILLNVQGDEPEIDPAALDRLVARLVDEPRCPCATLACPFPPDGDPRDPNCVKVVVDENEHALYFSRALTPYPRDDAGEPRGGAEWLLHVGVYAFRSAFLLEFASWKPSRLEQIERLEQLRVLERGYSIAVEVVEQGSAGVDTPEDYRRFVERMASGADGRREG